MSDISLIPISADPLTNTQMEVRRHSIEELADQHRLASPSTNRRKQKRPSISQSPPFINGINGIVSPSRKRSASPSGGGSSSLHPADFSSPLRQSSPSHSSPSNRSTSPPSLSIRPPADLFPPAMATSTPNKIARTSSPIQVPSDGVAEGSSPPSSPRAVSPAARLSKQQDLLKNQLMQVS